MDAIVTAKRTKGIRAEDQVIGHNVRRIRNRMGISQETLGGKLGLTFQQVQKYEKGTNRIGGSRMVQIAKVLGCSLTDLFEGTGIKGTETALTTTGPDPCLALGSSPLGVRWARAFGRLPPKAQRAMVNLAEATATKQDSAGAS